MMMLRAHLLVACALWGWCGGVYVPPGPKYACPADPRSIFPCECQGGGDDGLRVACHLSGLAPMAAALSNVAAWPLARLTVAHGRFSSLFGHALRPLRVAELRVEGTPVTRVAPEFFEGVNATLSALTMANTKITDFPTEAFNLLTEAKTLKVEGHAVHSMAASSVPLPAVEVFALTDGPLSDLAPDTFALSKKIKLLDLHANALTELKRGAFKGLRDLETLDLAHNTLIKVDSTALADLPKLLTLNLSHNALTELPRGGFARNTLLKHLDMSHNNLKRLEANTFRGLRFLRRLFFSDNLIEEVGRGAFSSLNRIGTIDLARNKLTKVDFQMFAGLRYAERLDVAENQITEIQKRAFVELYLVTVNVSHNQVSSIEAGAFENCANMTVLDLSHNLLTSIAKKAFDSVSYAATFLLQHNQIDNFATIPLANMSGLQVLNVSHNALTTIPRNGFPKLYELRSVDLSHNQLTSVANAVFQPLFSLRNLDLSHNALGKLSSAVLGALPSLLELDLRHNALTEVGRGAFARLSSCRTLLLGHNKINKIQFQLAPALSVLSMPHNQIETLTGPIEGESIWPTMNALLELDLDDNKLGDSLAEDSSALANLLTLRILRLNRNGLTRPPKAALGPLTSLQYVYLEGNNIQSLPKGAFGRLPIVFELQLAHNNMNNVSVRAFEGLLQLLTLNLSHNNITQIPNGAFQSLVSLRKLDLSHNGLEKLDNKSHGLLDDCLSLEKIDLSFNNIGFVTRPMFPSNPYIPYKLREVDLSHNAIPVLTMDLTWGAKKVQVLNVSHNLINEIRSGVLGNLTSLRHLDLSYNELSELPVVKNETFPLNLTSLVMNHNRFEALPLQELLKANLSYLDLSDNMLRNFSEELSYMVENGTKIDFFDNPLECSCLLRPVVRWLQGQSDPAPWDTVTCATPNFLQGRAVASLPEDKLTCLKPPKQQRLRITPDVAYRSVTRTRDGGVKMVWYVPTRQDIGNFQIIVRDKNTQDNVYEKEVPYNVRSDEIPPLQTGGDLQVCILAKDSDGQIRIWRENQCRSLDSLTSSATRLTLLTLPLLLLSATWIF
ncbi:chondroadherin-like protein [Neocloeon triangulifer]|uniref:chondroadherin-like protein n=1 Tax=Neocloeon triangulifer TaxID=2078957 RepID=UPI00286F6664|nr:chondroadherin-like protein [Neocloeon triangulifer]